MTQPQPHVHRAVPGSACACGVVRPDHPGAVPTIKRGNEAWLCIFACTRTGCTCRCGAPVRHTRQGYPTGQCDPCREREHEQRSRQRPTQLITGAKRKIIREWDE